MYIEELIQDAYLESKTVEYKGIIKEGNKEEVGWLKTLVAFANTDGGTLIIGVEDRSHKVVALDQKAADRVILMLHRQIKDKIEPAINYEVENIVVKDTMPARFVICVKVSKNKNLPVALHDNGMLGIYVRNFGRTDIATSEQIRDLVLMSDNTPYDVVFTDIKFSKNKFKKLYSVVSQRGSILSEKELISKSIISQDKSLSKGALLFSDDCNDSRTKVVVTQWPDVTKGSSVINASEEYVGNILETIEKTIQFIKNHSVNGFKKESDRRVEYFSYPLRAVTEGVVNAIGHRNYYIQGSQVEINIFKDRLEITSPGSLLGVRELHNEKNISSIMPKRRNEIICELLEMCKYMENRGSGFDKIEEDYKKYDEKYLPYVSANAQSFTLTLPDLTYERGIKEQTSGIPEVYVEVALEGKNDLKILSYCYEEERTIKEIANYLGLSASTYFRKNVIERLVSKKLLLEIKNGKALKVRSNRNEVYIR